jgi:hypothetical protein
MVTKVFGKSFLEIKNCQLKNCFFACAYSMCINLVSRMFNPRNSENDFFHKLDFNFDSSSLKPGDVLISEPFLPDPNFSRSVVLITEFDKRKVHLDSLLISPVNLNCVMYPIHFNTQDIPSIQEVL